MKEQNFAPKYMMGWKGFWPTEYMQGLGPDSDYVCYDAFWSEDLGYPGAKELGEAYKADHDGLDSVSIGLFYCQRADPQRGHREGRHPPSRPRSGTKSSAAFSRAPSSVTSQYDEGGVGDIPPLGLQWLNQKTCPHLPRCRQHQMEWFKAWDER